MYCIHAPWAEMRMGSTCALIPGDPTGAPTLAEAGAAHRRWLPVENV